MGKIDYLSNLILPIIILIILFYALKAKINIFDVFLEGGKAGVEIVFRIFPTLVGLFVAISALRSSGILEIIIKSISPLTNLLHIPKEIMPLALLRPVSRKCLISSRHRYNENIWC